MTKLTSLGATSFYFLKGEDHVSLADIACYWGVEWIGYSFDMTRLARIFVVFFVLFLAVATSAHACSGGFWGQYPRKITLAPQVDISQEKVRIVSYSGRDWLVPSPSGLFDLESLDNTTLPNQETFKALAFALTPGGVCFTNYSGSRNWPGNSVPVVARVNIRLATDVYGYKSQASSTSDQPKSDLSPDALKHLLRYLEDEKRPLHPMLAEEIYDRATPDITLISRYDQDVIQNLSVVFNINHGKALNDSLSRSCRLESGEWRVTLVYSIPLAGQNITASELGRQITLLEKSMDAWLQTFRAVNDLK